MGSSRRSRYLARSAWIIGALGAAYAVAAYVLVPALWSRYEHRPGLAQRPMVTATAQGIPGDPLNVGLVGSREEVVRAMAKSGWHAADPITLRTSLDIGVSVILSRPYPEAPVSSLYYEGRRQDLAFEKPVGHSPAARHHVRFWRVGAREAEGRDVWLGAASFDRGVGLSHDTGQITHHIDPDLDAERAHFVRSLDEARALARTFLLPGAGPTSNGRNGEGDPYFTDGDVVVGVIDPQLGDAGPEPDAGRKPP
jgi:LssY C-terminus